jgi:hypothetical protein
MWPGRRRPVRPWAGVRVGREGDSVLDILSSTRLERGARGIPAWERREASIVGEFDK